GEWIRQQSYTPLLRAAGTGLGTLGVVGLASLWLWPLARFRRARFVLTLMLGLSAATLHARAYPGQYYEAHLTLAALAALATLLAVRDVAGALYERWPRALGWAVAGGLAWASVLFVCFVSLPPSPRASAQLVYHSARVAPLFGTLFP